METRSFGPAATAAVVDLVCSKGWARCEVEPVAVAFLDALSNVIVCFHVECAADWVVGRLSEGFRS